MAQVSQYGLENGPADLQLESLSADEISDDENRDDEIKKLLEEGLSNETFDYDSDTSSQNASKLSRHNNCSFLSNKDDEQEQGASNGNTNGNGTGSGNGNGFMGGGDEGIFQTPKLPLTGALRVKRVDFSGVPDSSAMRNEDPSYPVVKKANGINGNGSVGRVNGGYVNGGGAGLDRVSQNQKNRDLEEVVVPSPTISLLHNDHCPQNGVNNVEQLKIMCDLREQHIQRLEASVETLQKDKRALNHQVGLIKAEMVHLRSQSEETEKYAQMKEEEVQYVKSKIQEAIEEYEKARRNEIAAKDESNRLQVEIDKLRQEVQLLSALGSSTQQAETSDVVRQLRQKHAQDVASWQTVVGELEAQVRMCKELRKDQPDSKTFAQVQTQTEYDFDEEIERREREMAVREFQDEFGDCGEDFLNEIRALPDREIIKRVRQEWKTERSKLINHYQTEIKIYQQKLSTLPGELYQLWRQTQEELGLNKPAVIKPICRSAETQCLILPTARTTADVSTFTNRIKTSSVIVQTDETLDHYKMLAVLIQNWNQECTASNQRAQDAEEKTKSMEGELSELTRKFQKMQKAVMVCRKESKKREEELRKENTALKSHYTRILQNLNDQLSEADQIEISI